MLHIPNTPLWRGFYFSEDFLVCAYGQRMTPRMLNAVVFYRQLEAVRELIKKPPVITSGFLYTPHGPANRTHEGGALSAFSASP